MKAIQTRYAGYFFRSRLEARWAVFFDALKLDWQYEPEGFELERRGHYLPDFRINFDAFTLWAEIKPPGQSCEKLIDLVTYSPLSDDWRGTILHDIPDPRAPYTGHDVWFAMRESRSGDSWGSSEDYNHGFMGCDGSGARTFDYLHESSKALCGHAKCNGLIRSAFAAARAARFEHEAREFYEPQPQRNYPQYDEPRILLGKAGTGKSSTFDDIIEQMFGRRS